MHAYVHDRGRFAIIAVREILLRHVQPPPALPEIVWSRSHAVAIRRRRVFAASSPRVLLIAPKIAPPKHRLQILLRARYPGCRKSQPGFRRPHREKAFLECHDTRKPFDTLHVARVQRSSATCGNLRHPDRGRCPIFAWPS
jgi:hypothetical protein